MNRPALLTTALAVAIPLATASCGSRTPTAQTPAVKAHETEAEKAAKVDKWFAREIAPVGKKHFELFEGQVSGDIESLSDIKPDCTNKDGIGTCTVVADLGKDADDENSVACNIVGATAAFGPVLEDTLLQGVDLEEAPTFQVRPIGEGLAATFVANTSQQEDDAVVLGTAKFAALYAHGYTVTCFETRAGGRKTFDRITTDFFQSLKLKSTVTVFAYGYQTRVGDQANGLRYAAIGKRPGDDAGYVESTIGFHLQSDGKTWSIRDLLSITQRDAKGKVENMESYIWADGKGPLKLSAKPSEDKRFRLKFEVGDKSSGIESTPKAPLNTELWAASELLRVSTGKAKSYRYAYLDLLDSDPAFHYVKITRADAGVLYEAEESLAPPKSSDAAGEEPSRDELSVDARGLVTKEVSSDLVSELVYTWGDLPSAVTKGKATGAKAKKRAQ
jgi:hypothetical protein